MAASLAEATIEWHVGLADKVKKATQGNEINGIKIIPWAGEA